MTQLNTLAIIILTTLLCSSASARGRGATSATSTPSSTPSNRIAICWTQQTNTTGRENTPNYGIVLTLEPNNGTAIAADTYLLDANLRKVKQVGHAEVAQETDAPPDTILSVTSTSDSPSVFSFLISSDPTENPTVLQGLLNADALFTGEIASNPLFTCRLPDWFPAMASTSPTPGGD